MGSVQINEELLSEQRLFCRRKSAGSASRNV